MTLSDTSDCPYAQPFIYLRSRTWSVQGAGLAALRTVALGALFLALFNPGRLIRVTDGTPMVLLDASLSMGATGGQWQAALDTARALSRSGGEAGTILRFGSGISPFDTLAPSDGASRLRDALEATVGRAGPVFVVSDGEIQDGAVLPPSLTHGVTSVILPRDTVANVALLDVAVGRRVQQDDSIKVGLVIGTWGPVDTAGASVEIFAGERRLLRRRVALPPPPGTARRTVTIPPGALSPGTHVLRVRLVAGDDAEPRDDERMRVVTVSSQPVIAVIVDPADVEGRFLMRELSEVARTTVRGFARVRDDLWLDMNTLARTDEASVRAAAAAARLVVLRGADRIGVTRTAPAVWYWPAASDPATEFFQGDWYITPRVPASPLAGRLAAAAWDSVPPLTGIVPFVAGGAEWVAVTGRRARRGVDRPVLIGRDSSGARRLTTAGSTAEPGTQRGVPVVFRWTVDDIPDSTVVTLAVMDSSFTLTLRYDSRGTALVSLDPGVYRWSARAGGVRNATGIAIVEEYSDEYHPREVTWVAGVGEGGFQLIVRKARDVWWLFLIAITALLCEWGWRQRRGLP